MVKFFESLVARAMAATLMKKPKRNGDEGGPVLEKTIPMPEVGVGVGVQEHLMDVRASESAEQELAKGNELGAKVSELKRQGLWAAPPKPDFAAMADRAHNAGKTEQALDDQIRQQPKRDKGMSM